MDPIPEPVRRAPSENASATARSARRAVVWCGVTLALTFGAGRFLPPGGVQFLATMWVPAATAVVFLLLERIPLTEGLNLRRRPGVGARRAWMSAFLVPLVTAVLTVALGWASGHLTRQPGWSLPVVGAALTLLIWVASSLGEELGWRGYLQNHLTGARHAPLWIGLVWTAWHFEHVRTALAERPYMAAVFLLAVVETSYVLSWMTRAGGGILAVGCYHGFWNFLRMKVLFGNPAAGGIGLFRTDAGHLTEMEGVFGLCALSVVSLPFVRAWYKG